MPTSKIQLTPLETGAAKRKASIPIFRGKLKKKYLAKHAHLLSKRDPAVGMLITCNTGMDINALGQARTLLDTFLLNNFPDAEPKWPLKLDKADFEIDHDFVPPDESRLSLKQAEPDVDRKNLGDRLFQAYDTGSPGYLFFRFRNTVLPTLFMEKLVQKLQSCKVKSELYRLQRQLAFCQRWLPVGNCCAATLADLANVTSEFVLPQLEELRKQGKLRIAILSQVVSNEKFSRKQAIAAIADAIPNSSDYIVDLKNPQVCIIATVIKSVAAISVVSNYYENKKYNLSRIITDQLKENNI